MICKKLLFIKTIAFLVAGAITFSLSAEAVAPRIDPRFSKDESAAIQEAILRIPDCHRSKIDKLRFVQSSTLIDSSDDCDEGFYPGNDSIILYSKCGFNVGTVVHEIFHHLGRSDNLNEIWKIKVLKSIPNCPVSEYAEEGIGKNNEDLAETGRILLVPESGQRHDGNCVDRKIEELNKLLSETCSLLN